MTELYVAPRPGFDVRSRRLTEELRDEHLLYPDEDVRCVRRYRVWWGKGQEAADKLTAAIPAVFADPAEERVLASATEVFPAGTGTVLTVAIRFHREQFDQRADAAEQALLLLGFQSPQVEVTEVTVLRLRTLTDDVAVARRRDFEARLVNPVDSELVDEMGEEGPTTASETPAVGDLETTGLSAADRDYVTRHFSQEGRDPRPVELAVIDTYWSDHCRHTTFRTELEPLEVPDADTPSGAAIRETWEWYHAERRRRGETQRPVTLMDMATAMMRWRRADGRLPAVVFSQEINACTVRVDRETPGLSVAMEGYAPWLVLFKNETHNHPTEVEPYGGAATCLGGAIRDPLSGRAYVYQAMRVTGSADPRYPEGGRGTPTMPGKLPQRLITRGAARGYSSYGNQVGVATGLVDEVYHPGYRAKRLEMGAVVGAIPEHQVRREEPLPGDLVVLLGGRTGRDGIGGATGSSKSHSRDSLARSGAEVQKGNPPVERALQRLFRRADFAARVKRSNDFGAGGVAVAVGEIADGLNIDLASVPLKYRGLTPREIAISESQERMAVVVAARDAKAVVRLASEENLEATVIAEVTAEPRLVMRYASSIVADIPRPFLDSAGVRATTRARIAAPPAVAGEAGDLKKGSVADVFAQLERDLSDLRHASRLGLSEWFDASIGSGTVLAAAAGRLQRSPVTRMAARLPHAAADRGHAPPVATVMAYGFDPEISERSPWHGAYTAVLESVARVAAAGVAPGAVWLSLQEYFPRPGDDPQRWGLPAAALLGALAAQRDLGVTAIGGKDSMSGSYEEIDVPPTLISVALGVAPADRVISDHCPAPDLALVLLPLPFTAAEIPDAAAFTVLHARLAKLISAGTVVAASPTRGRGWLPVVAQMCFGENLGFEPPRSTAVRTRETAPGSMVVALSAEASRSHGFGTSAGEYLGIPGAVPLGFSRPDGVFRLAGDLRRTADLYRLWAEPLEEVFPTRVAAEGSSEEQANDPASALKTLEQRRMTARRPGLVARPRVVIPVFPGTNCEDDSVRIFREAGALVRTVVLRTGSRNALEESLASLSHALEQAQILMLPGGFSAGDEPGGSGKFIAAVLRAPAVRQVIERHYVDGDRLILGICNGFQGLIRTGLVPFGEYRDRRPGWPALGPNQIGRHVSRMVLTRVDSDLGPWMAQSEPGDLVSVPVSHGEGRLTADATILSDLADHRQVAARYVDWSGRDRLDHPWNPNGSEMAIEALLSPDGRFLGKMGHTERERPGMAAHLPSVGDLPIAAAGVAWFS